MKLPLQERLHVQAEGLRRQQFQKEKNRCEHISEGDLCLKFMAAPGRMESILFVIPADHLP